MRGSLPKYRSRFLQGDSRNAGNERERRLILRYFFRLVGKYCLLSYIARFVDGTILLVRCLLLLILVFIVIYKS